MARPRARGFSRQKSARLTQWVGPADQGFIGVASGGAILLTSFPFEEPATIMRTRGNVAIRPAAFTADVDIVGAYGHGVVSQEAFAAGVVSIPEPFSDGDWGGWFVWRSFAYHFEFADATGVNFPNWTFDIDSKSMRKVSPNEVMVTIVESREGAFNLSSNIRTLIKLT